jgi:hypothetical protein
MDLTNWLTDEFLEDHINEPVSIWIKNLSKKYDVQINVQVFKKED